MEQSLSDGENTSTKNSYLAQVEEDSLYVEKRKQWHKDIAQSEVPYLSALKFLTDVIEFRYAYQWSWLGVPIIKLPEDIMVLQEFFHSYKPDAVIEIGVARGGGIKLYASLQRMLSQEVNVLGVDQKLFPHTIRALQSELSSGVILVEADSISHHAFTCIEEFIKGKKRILMILDGDHSHEQVLKELKLYGDLLPPGSYIIVADTIAEDLCLAEKDRPWGKGNNPKTGLKEFLAQNNTWQPDRHWGRRATISESRDGWIFKVE
jgi:cephalosporin hydroxylase